MNKRTHFSSLRVSQRLYAFVLKAYPAEFRREYGPHMAQVFRDCHCAAENCDRPVVLMQFWLVTLLDLIKTAPKEHVDNLRKGKSVMNNLRRDALALFGCVAIIAVAVLLHRYILAHQVVTLIGYALDGLIVTGVIGNFIVFLLVKTLACPIKPHWTFLMVQRYQ